jgi:hypothetical protein
MGYKGIDIPQIRKNKSDTENVISMEIKRNGSQPSGKGPADWFTGTVRIDPLFQANAPARAFAASVTFEHGARTAWHTHPLGQTLLVTAGFPQAGTTPHRQAEFPRLGRPRAAPSRSMSPFRNSSMGRSSIGWRRSATSNTAGDLTLVKWRLIERRKV